MNRTTSFDDEGQLPAKPVRMSRPIDITLEDEQEFFLALQEYKAQSGRLFPTCSELLEVLLSLGYAKRIWKPVPAWTPTVGQPSSGESVDRDSLPMVGWYSSVETPV
jgi:hypothetical protein